MHRIPSDEPLFSPLPCPVEHVCRKSNRLMMHLAHEICQCSHAGSLTAANLRAHRYSTRHTHTQLGYPHSQIALGSSRPEDSLPLASLSRLGGSNCSASMFIQLWVFHTHSLVDRYTIYTILLSGRQCLLILMNPHDTSEVV